MKKCGFYVKGEVLLPVPWHSNTTTPTGYPKAIN